MKIVLLTLTFIFSSVLLVAFFSIDACLDAGGQWGLFGFSCEGARADFVPQYLRPAPFFWGMVIAISALVTWFVNQCLTVVRP